MNAPILPLVKQHWNFPVFIQSFYVLSSQKTDPLVYHCCLVFPDYKIQLEVTVFEGSLLFLIFFDKKGEKERKGKFKEKRYTWKIYHVCFRQYLEKKNLKLLDTATCLAFSWETSFFGKYWYKMYTLIILSPYGTNLMSKCFTLELVSLLL